MISSGRESLWAISAYFNPFHHQNKLANYRTFHERLDVPLITVEWARPGEFELGHDDADVLIRVAGTDLLWHKDSLLNVAIDALPQACNHVAWLDCDVVFERDDWSDLVVRALQEHAIVHAFDRFVELPPDTLPEDSPEVPDRHRGHSFCHHLEHADLDPAVLGTHESLRMAHRVTTGFAWASHRRILETHRFYDRLIVGGSSRSMLCAALGRSEDATSYIRMNARQRSHFLEWARPFFGTVQGRLGYTEGTVFHLWHGDLADRKYAKRNEQLGRFDFDPYTDVSLDENGGLRWSTEKEALRLYVSGYFKSRNEGSSQIDLRAAAEARRESGKGRCST